MLSEYFPNQTPYSNSATLFRVHRKHGEVFALCPVSGPVDWERLLPAQSRKARVYRWMAGLARRLGIQFPRETIEIAWSPDNPLLSLEKISRHPRLPGLILPGNPHGIAPRLVIICPDEKGRPSSAIKAGHLNPARELIQKERTFLASLRSTVFEQLAPRLLGELETSRVSAFATEFVEGPCPPSGSSNSLGRFLALMIDTRRLRPLLELAPWEKIFPRDLPSDRMFQKHGQKIVHPCIFHGDFAPWNIRITPDGTWKAIDWERGCLDGIPGWDWFHFILQPAILVKKWKAGRVIELGRQTIASPDFLTYLDEAVPDAGKNGFAEFLLRSYLLYNWHVLQPTERREVHQSLAEWALS